MNINIWQWLQEQVETNLEHRKINVKNCMVIGSRSF